MNPDDYSSSFLQNVEGFIWFRFDKKFEIISIEGAVEEITGYTKEDFLSHKVKWTEIVIPEDQPLILEKMRNTETIMSNPVLSTELEYRIRRKDGDIKWIREVLQKLPAGHNTSGQIQSLIRDITEKNSEESLQKIEQARIKKFHHRIRNNLQAISSLLNLQADRFTDRKVIEAFRKNQSRVASIALIHEELYKGDSTEILDFAAYLQKLTSNLLNLYTLENQNIRLKLNLEQVYLRMDVVLSLGIVVNELISNSLKHAFPFGGKGEIQINFYKNESPEGECENSGDYGADRSDRSVKNPQFILTVSDNGKGFPEELDFRNTDSLGLRIVNTLVEQIGGSIELIKNEGTKFTIKFCSDSEA